MDRFMALPINPHADSTSNIATGLGASISCKFDTSYNAEDMAEAMLALRTA
jgi:hypothetical protein